MGSRLSGAAFVLGAEGFTASCVASAKGTKCGGSNVVKSTVMLAWLDGSAGDFVIGGGGRAGETFAAEREDVAERPRSGLLIGTELRDERPMNKVKTGQVQKRKKCGVLQMKHYSDATRFASICTSVS
jgi:hypothetical protein